MASPFVSANTGASQSNAKDPLFSLLIDHGDIIPDANLNEAPYSSLVKVEFNHSLCTGTLVKYDEVLTAGHCAINDSGDTINPSDYKIISSDGKHEWHVTAVKTHYNQQMVSDFSLLKIDNTDTSMPTLSLAGPSMTHQWLHSSYPSLLAVGYGIDLARSDKNKRAYLQQGILVPTTTTSAQETVQNGDDWFNTVGLPLQLEYNPKGVFATCSAQPTDHGDSGGPILYRNPADNKFYILGSTSWGLTVKDPRSSSYLSYARCIDRHNVEHPGEKISVFSDLTSGSMNSKLLKEFESELRR